MRRWRNRKFWQPVVIGLIVIYLATMLLSTYLVKERFVEEYQRDFEVQAAYLHQALQERIWEPTWLETEVESSQTGEDGEGWINASQTLLAEYFQGVDHKAVQMSAAIYEQEKRLVARSGNVIFLEDPSGDDAENTAVVLFELDEFLSQEEIEELASYQWENIQGRKEERPPRYRILARIFPEEKELKEILVQQITWEDVRTYKGEPYMDPVTGGGHGISYGNSYDATGRVTGDDVSYVETASSVVWEWKNPGVGTRQDAKTWVDEANVTFPYMQWSGYEDWRRWCESGYLQEFPEESRFSWEDWSVDPPMEVVADGLKLRVKYSLKIGLQADPFAYMEIRMECSPWAAALDYMKYLYLWGAILVLVCMWKIIYVFREVYNRQAALEETRRDFINAMAHELKTPLSVIRNFAENLLEHNMEDKRDYYLGQIIGQTEEMDGLVVEMIGISKLDSRDLELKKEPVSFQELIREQIARFEPMIQERELEIQIVEKGDLKIEGDREYLARAVWNLLSNAVEYALPDSGTKASAGEGDPIGTPGKGGLIHIETGPDRCIIENTAAPLSEDELCHAFDLFYTGDGSRSQKERHMGMGLFLARKILGLHGLELTLENTGNGVRVIVRK